MKRSNSDRVLGGVCGGIAKETGLNSAFIRFLFLVGVFAFGFSPIIYVILWAIMGSEE